MKHILMCATCFFGAPLVAETIGNVEFHFPPSNYEWKLLIDESLFNDYFEAAQSNFEDEEDLVNQEEGVVYEVDDEEEGSAAEHYFKIMTHREGDALELFAAVQTFDPSDDETDEEFDTLESSREKLDKTFNQFFPNHKLILHAFEDDVTGGYADWELSDGDQDIMHGYTRIITVNENGAPRTTILSYFTTANATEYNRHMWTEVLNQVRFIE